MSTSEKCYPSRERWWSEIDSDEKIERLRTVVKRLERRESEMRRGVLRLNRHLHTTNGEIVIKLQSQEPEGGTGRDVTSEDVYF